MHAAQVEMSFWMHQNVGRRRKERASQQVMRVLTIFQILHVLIVSGAIEAVYDEHGLFVWPEAGECAGLFEAHQQSIGNFSALGTGPNESW